MLATCTAGMLFALHLLSALPESPRQVRLKIAKQHDELGGASILMK